MKKILSNCFFYLIRTIMCIIYFFIKLFPTQKNKITMLSRQANKINIDFELLIEKLEKEKSNNIVILCKKIPNSILGRIKYCFYIIKCMYHIATSKICITDGYNIPICALHHKKKLVIIQIWHAMGAVKKFGYQILEKREGNNQNIVTIMKMHKNYTCITCTSEATKDIYSQAFKTKKEKIEVFGMPRIDYLLEKDNKAGENLKKLLEKYPILKNKKTILYIPTFRKNRKINFNSLIQSIDTEKYNLILRLHPLDMQNIDEKYTMGNDFMTQDVLKVSDYIITDYSALAFEASILKKPLFFYTYDLTEYEKNRGLNINLKEEMPYATSTNIQEIINKIEEDNYDYEALEAFRKKYVQTFDTNNTQRLVNYIKKAMEA